jgi:hypothetical protein
MIHEEDVPSVQCKMRLRGPKSMRKVDNLRLTFIDFYAPALIPLSIALRPRCSFFSKETLIHTRYLGVSFIYIPYNVGNRTEPYGTPGFIFLGVDISPSTKTLNFL